jgi:hypothetical protein
MSHSFSDTGLAVRLEFDLIGEAMLTVEGPEFLEEQGIVNEIKAPVKFKETARAASAPPPATIAAPVTPSPSPSPKRKTPIVARMVILDFTILKISALKRRTYRVRQWCKPSQRGRNPVRKTAAGWSACEERPGMRHCPVKH